MRRVCLEVTVDDTKIHIVQLQDHVFAVIMNIVLITVVQLVALFLYWLIVVTIALIVVVQRQPLWSQMGYVTADTEA